MTNDEIICPHCGKTVTAEHIFTRKELAKMDTETYEKNRNVILTQMANGKLI
jgi:uncharacterized Zn finger protein (UPF0148 family)